jgi:hypothetical protein
MQRRHFILLAAKVRAIRAECAKGTYNTTPCPLSSQQVNILTDHLADFCQHWDTSIGFNRTKFKEACKE